MSLWSLSIKELSQKVKDKEISAQEILDEYLSKIERENPELNAYINILEGEARFFASRVDRDLMRGDDPGILAGVPVAIKDNIWVGGALSTAGSKMLKDFFAPHDATVVRSLKRQGAVILGKTNLDELAIGSSNATSFWGPTLNPWDTSKVAGGSSGGSAAAVSAGLASGALGTDTGGSVRLPGAFTGISAMRPSSGSVSKYGVVPYAPSMDCVGPMGKTVEDCFLMFRALLGDDPKDSSMGLVPVLQTSSRPLVGLKVGVPKEIYQVSMESGVLASFQEALAKISEAGGIVEEISIPSLKVYLDAYRALAYVESLSSFARYHGVVYGFRAQGEDLEEMYFKTRGEGFGFNVKRSIILGKTLLSQKNREIYLEKAYEVRRKLKRKLDDIFQRYPIIVTPTAPTVAFSLEEGKPTPLSSEPHDVFTVLASLTGIPAISIPSGFSEGLPVGFQIMGRFLDDWGVLQTALAVEEVLGDQVRKNLPLKERCECRG